MFFAQHFFPPGNPGLAFLASLAVFWFGFIARPFGAVFFGYLGDLIGRKFTFMLTLGLMGLATFLVGDRYGARADDRHRAERSLLPNGDRGSRRDRQPGCDPRADA